MRILVVEPGPNFSVQDVARGWTRALGKLADVKVFDTGGRLSWYERGLSITNEDRDEIGKGAAHMVNEDLRALCYDWWPDLVVIVSSFFVSPHTYRMLRRRKHKIVTLFTECPYEDPHQVATTVLTDLAVVNDPTNLDEFRSVTDAVFLPHAYDPAVHSPGPAVDALRSDFCFVGTAYPSRVAWLEQVDWRGVDVALGGNWSKLEDSPLAKYVAHDIDQCLDNAEAVKFYRSTKTSLNLYRTEAAADEYSTGWAMGPREVELAATGTFYLTQERGENREVLPMIPTIEDPVDFSEQLRWWLARDDLRHKTAEAAREAIADRTFDNHAATVLQTIGL